jgi:hypothetical protein
MSDVFGIPSQGDWLEVLTQAVLTFVYYKK